VDDFKIIETLVSGDVDGDGKVGLADIQTLINAAFFAAPVVSAEVGDYSGDCLVSSPDIVRLLQHFFLGTALNLTCLP
jgi:hypothetical protein